MDFWKFQIKQQKVFVEFTFLFKNFLYVRACMFYIFRTSGGIRRYQVGQNSSSLINNNYKLYYSKKIQ